MEIPSPFAIFGSNMSLDLREKHRNLKQKLNYRLLSRQVKKWILTNTRTKIWILIFTILLWTVVVMNNHYSYSFSARLDVRNINPQKTLMVKIPRRVQASFSGRGIDLFYLLISRQQSFKFIVDCQSIKRFYDFPLNDYFQKNPDKVVIPRGANVRLDHIIWPETLHVVLDDLKTMKVPIASDVEIQLAPGYILLDTLAFIPDSVTISGPQTAVSNFRRIMTEKLVLRNVKDDITCEAKLMTSSDNVKYDIKSVRCLQRVDQLGERELQNIPVLAINLKPDQKVVVIPSTAALTVSGGISVLKIIKPEDIRIVFDLANDWRPEQSLYVPRIELPDGVLSWRNLTPETFELRLIRER